jgi:hypothetical protein
MNQMSRSSYYGSSVSANAFPGYTTAELVRDLGSSSLDDATRAKLETEIERRMTKSPKHSPEKIWW